MTVPLTLTVTVAPGAAVPLMGGSWLLTTPPFAGVTTTGAARTQVLPAVQVAPLAQSPSTTHCTQVPLVVLQAGSGETQSASEVQGVMVKPTVLLSGLVTAVPPAPTLAVA
jgi:hypothetical protein